MRPQTLFFSAFFYLSIAGAWPWPPDFKQLSNALARRQDGDSSSSSSKRPESTKAASSTKEAASKTDASKSAAATTIEASDSSASGTAKPTASASGTAAVTAAPTSPPSNATQSSSPGSLTAATTIPPNAPPGGISLISPAAATTTYFKIGSNITLAWNYTSLLSPPSAIDVVVSNSASTYTLTQNASVVATPTLIWDTLQYQDAENALRNDFYTLAVFDAKAGITAAPQPGQLSPYGINAEFGLYSTQAYTPIASGWICPNCNGAMSITEAQTFKFMGAMILITLISFTWFANGFLAAT